jgi:hypothetical protein
MKHSNHLLHVGCRTAPQRRVSAGCAPSGLALHLREHQGCRRCAQVFGGGALVSRIVFHMKEGPDAPQSARRCRAPLNARPNLFSVAYLDRRRLEVRIHGRPRSDRKKRFLLSAVAPSTIARHPREARPINWAQCGGLASGGETVLLTPRPPFTAPSCTLGNQVVGASDGAPDEKERRPTHVRRTRL